MLERRSKLLCGKALSKNSPYMRVSNKLLQSPSSLLITYLLPVSTISFGESSSNLTSPVSVAASLPAKKVAVNLSGTYGRLNTIMEEYFH